jgi:hypothetical protein
MTEKRNKEKTTKSKYQDELRNKNQRAKFFLEYIGPFTDRKIENIKIVII